MGDSDNRRIILRRRMAFLGGALAVVSGCDKNAHQKPPVDVVIGDATDTSGMPTAATPEPTTEPPPTLASAPSTAIPETTCDPDRAQLEQLKSTFDSIHAEIESIHASVPGGCAVTDSACLPKHKALASRYHALKERALAVLGLCGCMPPIVTEYATKQRNLALQRMQLIRSRVVDVAASSEAAGKKWDELVRNEATPRPCLSCIQCQPKSACD